MFNKIAVVLRGHVRTWDFTKEILFDRFSKLSKEIDYYFVTWDVPSLDVAKIRDDFGNRSLKDLIVVPCFDRFYYPFSGIAWLCQQVIDCPEYMANSHLYEAIIDTRPDVVPGHFDPGSIIMPLPNRIHTEYADPDLDGNLRMSDTFFILKPDVFERFTKRYRTITQLCIQNKTDIHISLPIWCKENGLTVDGAVINFWYSVIIRPDILEICDINDLAKIEELEHLKLAQHWANLSVAEKQQIIAKYNIPPEGYSAPGIIGTTKIA